MAASDRFDRDDFEFTLDTLTVKLETYVVPPGHLLVATLHSDPPLRPGDPKLGRFWKALDEATKDTGKLGLLVLTQELKIEAWPIESLIRLHEQISKQIDAYYLPEPGVHPDGTQEATPAAGSGRGE